ncbi:MAG: membrane-bound lytic murein transglycosylase MltF [Pseudomonadales bacterium]
MFGLKPTIYTTVFLVFGTFIYTLHEYSREKHSTQLESILKRGEITFSAIESSDTYYVEDNRPQGFEYELAKAFANHLNIGFTVTPATNQSQVLNAIALKNAKIAMLGPRGIDTKAQHLRATQSFAITQSVVVYRVTEGQRAPINLEQLADRPILIGKDPELIQQLNRLKQQHPNLSWQVSEASSNEILQRLSDKQTKTVILSKREFSSIGTYFPRLRVAFSLQDAQPVRWYTRQQSDHSLLAAINAFLQLPTTRQLIQELEHKYYFNDNPLNLYDTIAFKQAYLNRLPPLEPHFRQAAIDNNFDWKLLASIAYQESHWDPNAVSPTGVKGIMMLTNAAAKEVGVTERTDPVQSIMGGAKYLANIKRKIPERIAEPERTFFALAGYNIGFGHLEDARILAQRAGLDPDSWEDVNKMLPRLSKAKYYQTVKYGYARGYEPVNYVKNIREYLTIFNWQKEQKQLEKIKEKTLLSQEQEISTEPAPVSETESAPPSTL